MQNKIIIYEPIEMQNNFSVEELEIYQKIKNNETTKDTKVYVEFFDE